MEKYTDIPKERLEDVRRAMVPIRQYVPLSDFDKEEAAWIEGVVKRLLERKKAEPKPGEEKVVGPMLSRTYNHCLF